MKAQVARFYGWTNMDIKQLRLKEFRGYFMAMDCLNARESLDYLQLNTYHKMKKPQRDKIYKALEKSASRSKNTKVLTTTEAADFIKGKMNG